MIPAISEGAKETAGAVREKVSELGRNPAEFISNGLIKWGSVTFLAGVVAWALSVAATRAAQGYLTDIDNTLGLNPESPPTPPRKVVPIPQPPPPPPTPQQVLFINAIVADVNTLGTVNAAQNVALLQDVMNQLWALTNFIYKPMQTADPVTGTVGPVATDFPPQTTGTQLAIAIMQTATLIYHMEGRAIPDSPEWSWHWYVANQAQPYTVNGGTPLLFLSAISSEAMKAFALEGAPDWPGAFAMLANVGSDDNYKTTINGLASGLNATQPYTISPEPTPNPWGGLGAVVSDLSAVGTEIVKGAETVGADIEGAVVTAGSDLKGLFTEIGQGLAYIGKAIMNTPRLVFDSLGYATAWSGEMILDAMYVPLLAIGGGMLATGLTIRYAYVQVWPHLGPRLELNSNAFWAKVWNRFDKRFQTRSKIQSVWTQKSTEAMIWSANANPLFLPPVVKATEPETPLTTTDAPPTPEAPAGGPETSPPEGGGGVPQPAVSPPVDRPPEPPGSNEQTPPAAPDVSEPIPSPENPVNGPGAVGQLSDKPEEGAVPGGSTTEETEAFLGDHPSRAPTPDELRAQEEERVRTLPPEPAPTYAQRKEEREHERAERLLSLGDSWSDSMSAEG